MSSERFVRLSFLNTWANNSHSFCNLRVCVRVCVGGWVGVAKLLKQWFLTF